MVFMIRPILEVLVRTSGVYTGYVSTYENSGFGSVLYCIFTFVLFMCGYVAYYLQHKQLAPLQKTNFKFLLLMVLIGFVLYTATIGGGSTRMALYFTATYIWLFPAIITSFQRPKLVCLIVRGSAYLVLGILLCCFYYMPSGFVEASSYVPFFITR